MKVTISQKHLLFLSQKIEALKNIWDSKSSLIIDSNKNDCKTCMPSSKWLGTWLGIKLHAWTSKELGLRYLQYCSAIRTNKLAIYSDQIMKQFNYFCSGLCSLGNVLFLLCFKLKYWVLYECIVHGMLTPSLVPWKF